MMDPRGWFSRGYLPHFDGGEITQSVCFQLIDSIPRHVREGWLEAVKFLPEEKMLQKRRRLAEAYLDRGEGPKWLNDPVLAEMMQNALLFFDGQRYRMHAWVVMPNHVHALFSPLVTESMPRILASWKSFTANTANAHLGREGHFWNPESYDRYIRNGSHYANVKSYIEMNPVKAGLCANPEDWPWSSANPRFQGVLR